MTIRRRTFAAWPIAAVSAAAMGLFPACSDNDEGGGGGGSRDAGDGGGAISDSGGRDVATSDTTAGDGIPGLETGLSDADESACEIVPDNPEHGTECADAGSCPNGECTQATGETAIICRQGCVPEACETTCAANETCVPLIDAETREALTYSDGSPRGACVAQPEGTQEAYGPCGPELGACQSGSDCLVQTEGETEGMCFPDCGDTGTCPELDGFAGQCIITVEEGADPTYCAIVCDPAGADQCPAGMTCTAVPGGGICVL